MVTLGSLVLGLALQAGVGQNASDWSVFPGDGAAAANAQNVHDPEVIEYRGHYFCFSTNGSGFGLVRSSTDLKSWSVLGPVLPDTPEWLKARYKHRSLWAPDLVVDGDRLRMYYCASNFGTNESVIGMAECEHFDPHHPLEGWHDRGLVLESVRGRDFFNAIDPKVVADGDRLWMFFGSYFAGIHLVELDPTTGKPKDLTLHPPQCIARNTGESGNPLEAASVCHRGKYFYLFVSYGLAAQGIRSTYRIMVGRSESITGPFVDRSGKSMYDGGHENVLKTSPPMIAPGGSDVFQDHSGRWLMPYHFYDARVAWHGNLWGMPTLQVRELLWTEDGWPLPGYPVEALALTQEPEHHDLVGKWIHQADFGGPKSIELLADGSLHDGALRGEWSRVGNVLTLKWPKVDAPGEFWIDEVQLAYGDNYYVGRNQDGLVIRGARIEGRH